MRIPESANLRPVSAMVDECDAYGKRLLVRNCHDKMPTRANRHPAHASKVIDVPSELGYLAAQSCPARVIRPPWARLPDLVFPS